MVVNRESAIVNGELNANLSLSLREWESLTTWRFILSLQSCFHSLRSIRFDDDSRLRTSDSESDPSNR